MVTVGAADRGAEAKTAERRRLRSFGLTVGVAFVVLAGLLFWKEKPTYPYFGGAGILLILSGLLVPSALRSIERVWMIGARAMGYVMTRVILGLVFLLVFTPAGLLIRLLGKDPMHLRFDPRASSYWHDREDEQIDPERMERMF